MEFLFWLVVILVVIGMISSSVEKKKQQDAERQAAQEALRRRMEAENYILNSGDPEAIMALSEDAVRAAAQFRLRRIIVFSGCAA